MTLCWSKSLKNLCERTSIHLPLSAPSLRPTFTCSRLWMRSLASALTKSGIR